jgi:uncharacterized protein (DUF1015 family)
VSIVRPMKGLRPKPEFASQVASPPYDVLNTQEARVMAQGNPNSFLRVNKAELEFEDSVNPYGPEVYQRAYDNLVKLEKTGVMVRDQKNCFYLYRLTMNGRRQTGLVALTSVEEYDKGKIKKHEHTRPDKVNDRANHILQVKAQVGPVFTAFRSNPEISRLFGDIASQKPLIDFVAPDGIRHELWVVGEEDMVYDIIAAFARLDNLYIADGHHRSEAASEVARRMREKNPKHTGRESYNFFLNVLFPDQELHIMPYNRVIRDMNGMSLKELLERAAQSFDIAEHNDGELTPSQKHQFGLYAEGKWYRLVAKPDSFDHYHPTRSIDASVLSDNFLSPILGITNIRTDKRIDFVGGIRGTSELVKLVDSGQFKLAFSLFPTSIEQLLTVADAGEVMPPKSTWFEPKLRDGLVVHILDN